MLGDVYLGLRAARFTPGCHMADFQPCYSVLEWMVDQYQVSTDRRSGITNDPKPPDNLESIVRLLGLLNWFSVRQPVDRGAGWSD